MGDEMFQPDQILSFDDVKVELETSDEVPANDSRDRVRKPPIPITYQNKNPPHSQVDIKQTEAEDQTSRAMSNRAIRRTACNMTVALLSMIHLSIGDISVVEVSDSS